MRIKHVLEQKRRLDPLVSGANLNWSARRTKRLLSMATRTHLVYTQIQNKALII